MLGIEVLAPRRIVERVDLYHLALREVDSASIFNRLGGWRVRIVAPTEPEGFDLAAQRIRVRWRNALHEPAHVMLPNLRKVARDAIAAKFGD